MLFKNSMSGIVYMRTSKAVAMAKKVLHTHCKKTDSFCDQDNFSGSSENCDNKRGGELFAASSVLDRECNLCQHLVDEI